MKESELQEAVKRLRDEVKAAVDADTWQNEGFVQWLLESLNAMTGDEAAGLLACPKCGATDKWKAIDNVLAMTDIADGKVPGDGDSPIWEEIKWSGHSEVMWDYQATIGLFCTECKVQTIDLTD